jgi:hypothetical protein
MAEVRAAGDRHLRCQSPALPGGVGVVAGCGVARGLTPEGSGSDLRLRRDPGRIGESGGYGYFGSFSSAACGTLDAVEVACV